MTEHSLALDQILAAFGIEAAHGLTIADAAQLAAAHHPPFGPDLAALLLEPRFSESAAPIQQVLRNQYPEDHSLQVLLQQEAQSRVEHFRLRDLDLIDPGADAVALYVPPLQERSSFEALQETVAHLRAPDGCPWDREQTHRSLRRHLLEEAYEALEALDRADLEALQEELGDLLLQVLLQAQIASESGAFTAADVVAGIQAKLIRRHPHVFGELELDDVEQVLRNWEHFKEAEKGNGVLDGVPASLPALAQADELQGRAARIGFDWPRLEGVLGKVSEELEEVRAAEDPAERERELGDLLFAIVNYARWIKADPETALREANQRFRARFARMNQNAHQAGLRMDQLGIEELDQLWEAAKQEVG